MSVPNSAGKPLKSLQSDDTVMFGKPLIVILPACGKTGLNVGTIAIPATNGLIIKRPYR